MGRKRRTFTDKFKAKVALEAIKGVTGRLKCTTCGRFKVHHPRGLISRLFLLIVTGTYLYNSSLPMPSPPSPPFHPHNLRWIISTIPTATLSAATGSMN